LAAVLALLGIRACEELSIGIRLFKHCCPLSLDNEIRLVDEDVDSIVIND
jgi:hypothetical protein